MSALETAVVGTATDGRPARLIAFHLPQFHPTPENDAWWGKGFTEWTNVTRARPLFRGHRQPRLPADLGFYDLRLPEARAAQAELASAHGVEAFCYWHYWFHGRRLLNRPVDGVLASGEPDFPFCLAWANEQWSRSWLGDTRQVLLAQEYSEQDDREHARWLAAGPFSDRRYVRIHGRPLFLIYKPKALPDARRTTDILRRECEREGLPEPYLVGIDAHCPGTDFRPMGFDMTEHHEPQLGYVPEALGEGPSRFKLRRNLRRGILSRRLKVYTYEEAVRWMRARQPAFPHFPCCFVGWDNTARRGREAIVMTGATPEAYARSLSELVALVRPKPAEERVIFVNAWNEWAEGMYLEPDSEHGLAYLEATAGVLAAAARGVAR